MVGLTATSIATVLSGQKGAAEGALAGVSVGVLAAGTNCDKKASVGGAAGAGLPAGAITGAATGKTKESTAAGLLAGGTAASGISLSGYAGWTLATAVTTGGLGLLAVGVKQDDKLTYDCWKPVVHEMSEKPSNGMLLKDLVCHPNVAKYTITQEGYAALPYIVVHNIWEEKFEIQYFVFHDSGKIVCHAKPLTM